MSDAASDDTIIAKLAADLVAAAFEVQPGPKRDCVVNALEDILAAHTNTSELRPVRRRRRRKNTDGAEAAAPAAGRPASAEQRS